MDSTQGQDDIAQATGGSGGGAVPTAAGPELDQARQRAEAALRRARAREQESEARRAKALAAREQSATEPRTGMAPPVVVADKPTTGAPPVVVADKPTAGAPPVALPVVVADKPTTGAAPVVVADKPTAAQPQRTDVDDGWAELFTYDDDVAPAPSTK